MAARASSLAACSTSRRFTSSAGVCTLRQGMLTQPASTPLRLTFNQDAVDFLCATPMGKAEDVCPCEGDGQGLEIGFNDRYLSDALKNAPTDEVVLCLNTGSSPCILKASDGSDSFTYTG